MTEITQEDIKNDPIARVAYDLMMRIIEMDPNFKGTEEDTLALYSRCHRAASGEEVPSREKG